MVERRQTRSIDASANNIDQKTNPKSNLSLSVCGTGEFDTRARGYNIAIITLREWGGDWQTHV